METPECDKKAAVGEEWSTILQFFEWAKDNGYHFTKTVIAKEAGTSLFNGDTYEYEVPVEVPVHVEGALYDFFEIDPVKLELERRSLLDVERARNKQ